MVKLEGIALAGVIGGSVGVVGLLSCCTLCLCLRRRRRIQRRRAGEAERGRATPRTVGSRQTPPAHDDLELGRRGRVVEKVDTPPPPPPPPASPDQVDTEVGRRGRDIVREVDPGRRSSSAPAELRVLVHHEPGQASGGIAAPALSPRHVVAAAAPPTPAGSDGFIDLHFDGERQGYWNAGAALQAEGDGDGEIVDEAAAGNA